MAKKTEIGRVKPPKRHHSSIRKKVKPDDSPNWVPISPTGGGSHIWSSGWQIHCYSNSKLSEKS